jgi:tetratricopeptide (TPR) repeat protein
MNLKNIYQTLDLAILQGITHLEAGDEYLNVGLFSQALREFSKVLEEYPQNKLARQKRIEVIVNWAKDTSCEKKDYDQVITLCKKFLPDIGDQNAENALTLLLGYAYMQKGEAWYDKAIEELKKIPVYPQANYYLGLIYFNQSKFEEASAEFQEAKKSDMDNPEYYFMLAKLHFYLKNYKLAKGLFQKALEKIGLQIDKTGQLDSLQLNYLCERKNSYEQDLIFTRQDTEEIGILPSDKESIGLLVHSDNSDSHKSVYQYIKYDLEKYTSSAVVDYEKYANLVTGRFIPEDCTKEACLAEYSWLTNIDKLLLVSLNQLGERLLISFSLYFPKTKNKKTIYDQEFPQEELYISIKQALEKVANFLKKQQVRVYCELCPEI